jgi:hypothetical protein
MVNTRPGVVGTTTWLLSIGGGIAEETDKKLDNEGIEARIVFERSILEEADRVSDNAGKAADEASDSAGKAVDADKLVELDNGDEAPTTGDVK